MAHWEPARFVVLDTHTTIVVAEEVTRACGPGKHFRATFVDDPLIGCGPTDWRALEALANGARRIADMIDRIVAKEKAQAIAAKMGKDKKP